MRLPRAVVSLFEGRRRLFLDVLAACALVLAALLLAATGCASSRAAEVSPCPACVCNPPAPSGAPALLASYAEILEQAKAGRSVRLVFDYAKCTLEGAPGPAAVGGMTLDAWEWFDAGVVRNDKAYLAGSASKLISLGTGYRINYVKVRVPAEGPVQVIAEYLDPASYARSMHEEFSCPLTTDPAAPQGATAWAQ